MKQKEGKSDGNMQEAMLRLLDITEGSMDPEIAQWVNWVEAGCPARSAAAPIRGETDGDEVPYIDREGAYWDEVSGKGEDEGEVTKAMMKEVTYGKEHELYVKEPMQQLLGRHREGTSEDKMARHEQMWLR